MIGRILELSNSANWENFYSITRESTGILEIKGRTLVNPIPLIDIPLILEVFVLAIKVSTTIPEQSNWDYGGTIYQKISTGIVIGGTQDAIRTISRPLYLNQTNLILWDKITANYSIAILPPNWFRNITIEIWKYTGIDDNSLAVQFAQEMANINFKLDQLLDKLQ